jgi:hypothetical protein
MLRLHTSAASKDRVLLGSQASAALRYCRDGGGMDSPCHARACSSRAARGATPSYYRLYTVTSSRIVGHGKFAVPGSSQRIA